MRLRSPSALAASAALVTLLLGFAACGDDAATPAAPSSGGASGQAGASAGAAGTGAGSGGLGGSLAGAAGAAGTAGAAGQSAGAAGAVAAGSAGAAGQSAGSAGQAAGSAGASGGGACSKDADCPLPTVNPAGCAVAQCASGKCVLIAKDGDGDGFGAAVCAASNGSVIALGGDCDDANPNVSPGAWDGPAEGTKPNRCGDGIDQDCSGKADDGKTSQGAGCGCVPGDVRPCAEESSGKPITFPAGPGGKPFAPCKLGSQTCLASGNWGPCTDSIAPEPERCDEVDNDCNGVFDDVPSLGTTCDVLGKSVGACKGGGKLSCEVGTNGKPGCKPADPRIGGAAADGPPSEASGWVAGFAPNGSGDWDCDGKTEESAPAGVAVGGTAATGMTCGPIDADAACKTVVPTPTNACSAVAFTMIETPAGCATACTPASCPDPPITCGATLYQVDCNTFQKDQDPCIVTSLAKKREKQLCR